jgi:hypothetical protein
MLCNQAIDDLLRHPESLAENTGGAVYTLPLVARVDAPSAAGWGWMRESTVKTPTPTPPHKGEGSPRAVFLARLSRYFFFFAFVVRFLPRLDAGVFCAAW